MLFERNDIEMLPPETDMLYKILTRGVKMEIKEHPVVWFQASECGGCTVSVLNTVSPSVRNLLLDPVAPGGSMELVFQLSVMAGSGETVMQFVESKCRQAAGKYILVVEGATPYKDMGRCCTIGEKDHKPLPVVASLKKYAKAAMGVIALGTCAAFGGVPAATPNPTNCKSVNHFLSIEDLEKPFINLPGCPCHPDWFTVTLSEIILNGFAAIQLDDFFRPVDFYRQTVHENCPRQEKWLLDDFAKQPGDAGCMLELGCKGPDTRADCPVRKWNSGISWCVEAGTPCIGCAHPDFPDFASLIIRSADNSLRC